MNKSVRIYNGERERTNLIGFSRSVSAEAQEEIINFLDQKGYLTSGGLEGPDTNASWHFAEVKPPLRDEDLKDFGMACIYAAGLDTDGLTVIDNRDIPFEEIPIRDVRISGQVVAEL